VTDVSIVVALQNALRRADPTWVNQPSHLRRRLEEEFGADARQHRSRIHQLVVAAEERIPTRLQRSGWSDTTRADLARVLIDTRGWTPEASDWAIDTWAAALGVSDHSSGGSRQGPSFRAEAPRPKQAASEVFVGETELPERAPATELPDRPSVEATEVVSGSPVAGRRPRAWLRDRLTGRRDTGTPEEADR
jgi:hypothetical protein